MILSQIPVHPSFLQTSKFRRLRTPGSPLSSDLPASKAPRSLVPALSEQVIPFCYCYLMARKLRLQYPGAIHHVMNSESFRE
jgi:hypothetical protein